MNLPVNFIKGFADIVANFSTNYGKYRTVGHAKTAYYYDIEFLKKHYPIKDVDWSEIFRINMNMQVWLSNVNETENWIFDIANSIAKELKTKGSLKKAKDNIQESYPDTCKEALIIILDDYLCKDDLSKISKKINKRVSKFKENEYRSIDMLHIAFSTIVSDEYDIPNFAVMTAINIPLLAELSKMSGFSFENHAKRDELIRTLMKNRDEGKAFVNKESISF